MLGLCLSGAMDIDMFDEELQQALGAVAPSLLEATAQALKDAGIVRGDDVRIATDAQLRECGVSLGAVNSLRRTLGPTGGGGQGPAPPQPGPGEASQPHRRGVHLEGVDHYGPESAHLMRRVVEHCDRQAGAFEVQFQEDAGRSSAVLTVTVNKTQAQSMNDDQVQIGFGFGKGGLTFGFGFGTASASNNTTFHFAGSLALRSGNPQYLLQTMDRLPMMETAVQLAALEKMKQILTPPRIDDEALGHFMAAAAAAVAADQHRALPEGAGRQAHPIQAPLPPPPAAPAPADEQQQPPAATQANPAAGQRYVIQRGDTLSSIAIRARVGVQQIQALNPHTIRNVNQIRAGDAISLPAGARLI